MAKTQKTNEDIYVLPVGFSRSEMDNKGKRSSFFGGLLPHVSSGFSMFPGPSGVCSVFSLPFLRIVLGLLCVKQQ